MTFQELGATLRAEREKRDLNINDVASRLKINPRQLRAIEEGDVGSLPHPAYVRGFVRSYASWLGLGDEEIQGALAGLGSTPVTKAPKKRDETMPPPEEPKPSSHRGLYTLVVLCLLGAGAWFLWDSGKLDFLRELVASRDIPSNELQSADAYMAAKDAEKARKTESVASRPEPEPRRPLPLPGTSRPVIKPTVQGPALPPEDATPPAQATPVVDAPVIAEQAPTSEPEPAPVPATPGQHKLIITAIEECWVHSNADKTDTRQFSLRKGDTFALTFGDNLVLKLGNAGGVRLRYDGEDLPPPGTSGQVRTLVFPPKSSS